MKKIIFGFLLIVSFGFFFVPTCGAITDTEKQQLIATLTQQIAELQSQLAAMLASQSSVAPTPEGSLSLAVSSQYSNQSISIPQTNFKIGEFTLTNNTAETININSIDAELTTGDNNYASGQYVTNLYVKFGNLSTDKKDSPSRYNNWQVNLSLSANTTATVSVFANISSSLPTTSTLNSKLLIKGTASKSNISVYTNSNAGLSGQTITFSDSSLSVAAGSNTPDEKIVAANQEITAGEFKFTSSSDSFILSDLKFVVPNSYATALISQVILADSATQKQIASTSSLVKTGDYYVLNFSGLNYSVPLNANASITVLYNLKAIGSTEACLGLYKNISPILIYAKAKNSKSTVDGSAANYSEIMPKTEESIDINDEGVVLNNLYVLKTFPTFSAQTSTSSAKSGTTVDLYKFTVSADPHSDTALKQITFDVNINSVNFSAPYLKNFRFYKDSNNYGDNVLIAKKISMVRAKA